MMETSVRTDNVKILIKDKKPIHNTSKLKLGPSSF